MKKRPRDRVIRVEHGPSLAQISFQLPTGQVAVWVFRFSLN